MRFAATLMLAVSLLAAKPRGWKTGWLMSQFNYVGGTWSLTIDGDGCDSGPIVKECITYTVEFRTPQHPALTVKGKIRFAIEKDGFYVLDENGREYRLRVTEKVLQPDNYTPDRH